MSCVNVASYLAGLLQAGGGGALDPQFLADHLTLAQPGGTLFPQAPRIFRPSDGSDYALLIQ